MGTSRNLQCRPNFNELYKSISKHYFQQFIQLKLRTSFIIQHNKMIQRTMPKLQNQINMQVSINSQRQALRHMNSKAIDSIRSYTNRIKRNQQKQKQRIFTQSWEYLGNPENQYVKNRIKNYACIVENFRKSHDARKINRKLSQNRQLGQSINSQLSLSSRPCEFSLNKIVKLQERNHKYKRIQQQQREKAYLLNQSEKIERLISKKKEKQEKFKCLSQKIKVKLVPKKSKLIDFMSSVQMQKQTWYQSWRRSERKQKLRTQQKIIKKHKLYEHSRFYTDPAQNNIQFSR